MTIKEIETQCLRLLDPSTDTDTYTKIVEDLDKLDMYTLRTLKKMLLTFYMMHEHYRAFSVKLNRHYNIYVSVRTLADYLRPLVAAYSIPPLSMWYVTGGTVKNYREIQFLRKRFPALFPDDYTCNVFLAKHMTMVQKYMALVDSKISDKGKGGKKKIEHISDETTADDTENKSHLSNKKSLSDDDISLILDWVDSLVLINKEVCGLGDNK